MSKLFTDLWNRINNSGSACPDIEIGRVKQLMADILAKYDKSNLNCEEKWIRALITISPIEMSDIEFYYEYKNFDRYRINFDRYRINDFDELDKKTKKLKRTIKKSINSLVKKELILIDGNGKYISNKKFL